MGTVLGVLATLPAASDPPPAANAPASDAEPISAREIYRRVLANRFRSFVQYTTMRSGDRGGREQLTKLRMHWQDFSNQTAGPSGGVLSKSRVKYSHPFDIRHAGYLIIHYDRRKNDQFVYLPTRRKVQRVNLRSENVYGTDFSFEDLLPRELQDATYRRFEDSETEGIPTYTVEAIPTGFADSEYSRFVIHVDMERWIVLLARYWNEARVEVKEMRADVGSVQEFDGIFVPMRTTMRSLLLESSTTLHVTRLEPNPDIPRSIFAVQRLESH